MDPNTRPRTFAPLAVGAAVLALLAAAACNRDNGGGSGGGLGATAGTPRLRVPGDTGVLRDPLTIHSDSATHILDVVLSTVDTFGVNGTGTDTLMVYKLLKANGVDYSNDPRAVGLPGPTFVVQPGDSVRLLLVNNLPPNPATGDTACQVYKATTANPPADTFPDCFHGPSSTNIHYHGFHVTPASNGDDVLLTIDPGQSHQYAFRIPANQSPGTHWYHPHKHGSVALQVTNGMSGAFIVEDPRSGLDSLTKGMKQHVLAVQQISTLPGLMLPGPAGGTTLVNGQTTPRIIMQAGEVQRWRIVDENINPFAQFSIGFDSVQGAPQFWGVARDGVTYAPANYNVAHPDSVLTMGPGNRLDILVKAPQQAGTFRLHLRSTRSRTSLLRTRRGGGGGPRPRALQGTELSSVLAATSGLVEVVVVKSSSTVPVDTTIPTALPPLPPFLANLSAPADTAVVVYQDLAGGKSQTSPTQFFLGTLGDSLMRFNPDSVYVPQSATGKPLPMELGDTQDWIVLNRSAQGINHPFHIHINPFQVLRVGYGSTDPNAKLYASLQTAAANGFPIWLDVVPLPIPWDSSGTTVPGSVHIRQEYKDFTGSFVMHCHILGHEERGMMQLLQVNPPGTAPSARAAAAEMGHRH